MLQGALILWLVLTFLSLVFVIYDLVRVTPEHWVMKLGWGLVVLYTGPFGLFLYLISCREPMPGTHEKFIESTWKQSLGSEIHCLAGDATGIILAAIVLYFYELPSTLEIIFEYWSAFVVGLFVFQALFMKEMHGGTYLKAVKNTVYSEWVSMNMIMAGMIPVMIIWGNLQPLARNPLTVNFWGMMSLATIIGGIIAYPMNHWLVKKGLKHGMMTIRQGKIVGKMHKMPVVSKKEKSWMFLLSVACLGLGIAISIIVTY